MAVETPNCFLIARRRMHKLKTLILAKVNRTIVDEEKGDAEIEDTRHERARFL